MSVLNSAGHTRRGLLVVVATAALSGCALVRPESQPTVDNTPVLHPLLDFASNQVAKLDAAVAAGAQGQSTLEMLRQNHSAHAAELARIIGVDVPEGNDDLAGDPLEELFLLESDGVDQAIDACVESHPKYAVLLGEIAACRATHADVLEVVRGQ